MVKISAFANTLKASTVSLVKAGIGLFGYIGYLGAYKGNTGVPMSERIEVLSSSLGLTTA